MQTFPQAVECPHDMSTSFPHNEPSKGAHSVALMSLQPRFGSHCYFCHIPYQIKALNPAHIQEEGNWSPSFEGASVKQFKVIP